MSPILVGAASLSRFLQPMASWNVGETLPSRLPSGFISLQTNRIHFLRSSVVTINCIGFYIEKCIVTNPVRFAETHVFAPLPPLDPSPLPRSEIWKFRAHLFPRLY